MFRNVQIYAFDLRHLDFAKICSKRGLTVHERAVGICLRLQVSLTLKHLLPRFRPAGELGPHPQKLCFCMIDARHLY